MPDIPDNGVDEDCSGVDAVNADRDADGSRARRTATTRPPPSDPGALEVIGNDVDENCDGAHRALPADLRVGQRDLEQRPAGARAT